MVEELAARQVLSNSALDQHLEVAVEAAEHAFLRGEYRRALKDANRCLVYATTPRPSSVKGMELIEEDCFRVSAPLHFPLVFEDNHPFYIRIDSKSSDLTDRAAAVALQCWYELSQKISDSPVVRDSHLTLLQPFWKAYSADDANGRSFSVELVMVLIRFFQATNHVHEAYELSLATLDHLLSSSEISSCSFLRDQRHLVQELVSHLFLDMMPYSATAIPVSAALRRLSVRETQKDAPSDVVWQPSKRLNDTAARMVLRFLQNPPVHWPEESKIMLEACQLRLDEELLRHGNDSPQDHALENLLEGPSTIVAVSGLRESSGAYSILPTLGWDGSIEHWLRRVLYLSRVCVVEALALSERRWENRGKLTLSIWTFWMAWKQRKGMFRISKKVILFLIKPLQEIVEALLPAKK